MCSKNSKNKEQDLFYWFTPHNPDISQCSDSLRLKLGPVEKILAEWHKNIDIRDCPVPRILMQTWKTNNIPDKWRQAQPSIRKEMPDWHLILLTDEDNDEFVRIFYPKIYKTFLSYAYGIQRADVIRYLWLHRYGGIYLDLDFVVQHNLELAFTLFENKVVGNTNSASQIYFACSSNVNTITNWFIASAPNLDFWDYCISVIPYNAQAGWIGSLSRELYILNSTGPIFLNRAVTDYASKHNFSYTLIDPKKLNPYNMCTTCYNSDTLLRPLEGSSWFNNPVYKICYCWMYTILIFLGFIILLMLYFCFYKYYG